MSTTTTTGTLAAGSSKTFTLAPGAAVSLTLSPNVRVTITESPESVSGSGVGGNTTRTHEPQLPGTFAYGPYAMGGVVVVAVASNSGSSVAWTRKDTVVTTSSDGTSLVSGAGTNFYIGPTSDYEYPPTLVEITASQGVVGKSCGLLSVKCVAGSAIALTVYDNATTAAGTVLFSQTMSAGNAAVFPAPVQAINGVWAAFSGTATFEIEVQDVI